MKPKRVDAMKNDAKILDIVIINYNSTDYLLKCLHSVYHSSQIPPANIFIQDNSSNGDMERVIKEFPKVLLSINGVNLGFAKAVNIALEQSTAPYIVLLNPDTYVFDGFFRKAINFMEENPDVGIAGPKIVDYNGKIQGSARRFPTPLTALFGRNTILSKIFPNNQITRSNVLTTQSDGITPMEVDWVSGACLMARRKAVEEIGYLDERFFLYWEDADWCRRMRDNSWKVVYFPRIAVAHRVGGSSSTRPIQSRIAFHRSSYRFFKKYNKSFLKFLNPFVKLLLAIRLVLTLVLSGVRLCFSKLQSFMSGKSSKLRISEKKYNQ